VASRLSIHACILWLCACALPLHAATPMLDGGADHSLFLSGDGSVLAVGSDASGQLGQGRTLSTETPVATRLSAVQRVASGSTHNLALKTDGTVWAWGGNLEGQLGDGSTISRSLPQQVAGLAGVAAIAAGEYHSLAALQDGSVRAWGNNRDGQLGDGGNASRQTPTAVSGLTGVTAVAAGHDHSLALKSDGTVWAWGGNYWGQLGNETDTDSNVPVQVRLNDGTPLANIVAIAAGHSFSVAIDRDGNVLIWGYLYYDETADATEWVYSAWYKTDVPLAQAVAAGNDHVLVLDRDGYLWAWGGNYYGQIGNGTDSYDDTVTSITAYPVSNLAAVRAIAAGQNHSLAVKSDGTVWRWGFSRYAPDIDPEYPYRFYSLPHQVSVDNGGAVSAGASHSLALLADGTVRAWGDNADGQLGDGALMVNSVAAAVAGLAGVKQVAAGNYHGLALLADNTVKAWGAGRDGQLGNGRRIDVSSPVSVNGLTNVQRIAAAGMHSLAIKTDGTVWAWGNNYYGQLGNGAYEDKTEPVQVYAKVGETVRPLTNIVAVCGGDWHSAAVDSSGTVWHWGYSYYDYDDPYSYYARAVPTGRIPAAQDVACGAEFTLALARAGTVWAWGNNYFGQLGDGTDIDSYPAGTSYSLQSGSLDGVVAIAAGYYHSIALKGDGTVWRWGYSYYDAPTETDYYAPEPVRVTELSQIAAIGAGDWHSLALRTDGTVLGWGFNYAGQLADGTYEEFRSIPQLAVNSTVNGLLDLDTTVANNVACPVVVQAEKSGSVDAVTAGFRLYVGEQTNCTSLRKRAGGGYQVFVAALHPTQGMFLLKGVENGASLPAPTWTQYLGGPLPVFAANAGAGGLDEHVQATLIDGVDTRQLAGFDVYVGYGTSEADMLQNQRYKRIFTLGADGRPVAQK